MQWLGKLDAALDRAFLPAQPSPSPAEREDSSSSDSTEEDVDGDTQGVACVPPPCRICMERNISPDSAHVGLEQTNNSDGYAADDDEGDTLMQDVNLDERGVDPVSGICAGDCSYSLGDERRASDSATSLTAPSSVGSLSQQQPPVPLTQAVVDTRRQTLRTQDQARSRLSLTPAAPSRPPARPGRIRATPKENPLEAPNQKQLPHRPNYLTSAPCIAENKLALVPQLECDRHPPNHTPLSRLNCAKNHTSNPPSSPTLEQQQQNSVTINDSHLFAEPQRNVSGGIRNMSDSLAFAVGLDCTYTSICDDSDTSSDSHLIANSSLINSETASGETLTVALKQGNPDLELKCKHYGAGNITSMSNADSVALAASGYSSPGFSSQLDARDKKRRDITHIEVDRHVKSLVVPLESSPSPMIGTMPPSSSTLIPLENLSDSITTQLTIPLQEEEDVSDLMNNGNADDVATKHADITDDKPFLIDREQTKSEVLSDDSIIDKDADDGTVYDDEDSKLRAGTVEHGLTGLEFFQASMGDIVPRHLDSQDQDEESSDASSNITSSSSEEEGDFNPFLPLNPWDDMESLNGRDSSFQSTMNCYGVVHLRLFRAQHLTCTTGSGLHCIISLLPWKGRIRTDRLVTYDGPTKAGVCARWDLLPDGSPCHSMVHAYNSDDTPVPSIAIDLVSSSLQMFEHVVCTVKLSCEPLMRHPGVWRQRWCEAVNFQLSKKSPAAGKGKRIVEVESGAEIIQRVEMGPLILLEACFEPIGYEGPLHMAESEHADEINDAKINTTNHQCPVINVPMSGASQSDLSLPTVSSVPRGEETRSKRHSSVYFSTPAPKHLTSKPHLFQVTRYWTPAYCAVCSSLLGYRVSGYRCEECKIDCCSDCQLQVDVQFPCGSDLAKNAVETSFQTKYSFGTTVGKIMSIVAPIRAAVEEAITPVIANNSTGDDIIGSNSKEGECKEHIVDDLTTTNLGMQTGAPPSEKAIRREGIGKLKLRIVKACLYQKPFPPEAELEDIMKKEGYALRSGDHYARVSWTGSKETKRTKTVFQSAKPLFDAEEMHITSSHYGTEFRIELIDALTDRAVGTTLLSTQTILQWQRDTAVVKGGLTLSSIIYQRPSNVASIAARLELRKNVKSGFGLDFFNAGKKPDSASNEPITGRGGEITGWIEVDACLEEDPDLLSYSDPKPCPARPADDFNVDMIQLHIARITALVDDIRRAADSYFYLISWKNPLLTGFSLLVFVVTSLRFNTEYFGSLPLFFLLVYLIHLARVRRLGNFKNRWIRKEMDARTEAENNMATSYDTHRPVATLKVGVSRGRNLRSRELGLPGSLSATIFWDPVRFADDKTRTKITEIDISARSPHAIGSTESSGLTFHPVWTRAIESEESYRLKQLLPGARFWNGAKGPHAKRLSESDHHETDANMDEIKTQFFHFPVLQPIAHGFLRLHSEGNKLGGVIAPWESSPGAIVFQIRFSDVLNKLPVFDDILGEVVIPVSHLVQEGEIQGWFRVLEKGSVVSMDGRQDLGLDEHDDTPKNAENPEVYVYLKIALPDEGLAVTDSDRETSIVVAEEMIRASSMAQEHKIGIIGTSISTFNTVRGVGGNIQYLQNQLGLVLDSIEMVRNLFNFTCPEKSVVLFLCVGVLWVALALIPTRVLVLCGGVAQYAATFVAAFFPRISVTDEMVVVSPGSSVEQSPVLTWMMNFFISIPTDEDLRRTYFWEARRVGERKREELAAKKRDARLRKLWNASWFGKLELKEDKPSSFSVANMRKWEWEAIFALIQGHRFLWWRSEKHFDDGEPPLGQIYFAGHSGLAGLSPLDLRELRKEEIPLVVSIFGRGLNSQQKVILLSSTLTAKYNLESAVLESFSNAKND